jgi:hypothetical protein
MRLAPPPHTPYRAAPSPTMTPATRRGRVVSTADEGRLHDLSPETTLRAFTSQPSPLDTSRPEYSVYACIDSLTAAERDLGMRVALAAQRLQSWCAELNQWGWTGSFEPPTDQVQDKRRRDIMDRMQEHGAGADALPSLEYWGSMLAVEVQAHEARLDDMADELLKLDVDELKEFVLDMHPAGRSLSSSTSTADRIHDYRPLDDFSFLITQTLLSALPHHALLKERLSAWTARVSILRSVPRYLSDLSAAQNAMRHGWAAVELPTDTSDDTYEEWKYTIDTVSGMLQSKVNHLGQHLDGMLDTLEGRNDCLPDRWIDIFEGVEADYGRWSHISKRKVLEFGVRRKSEDTERRKENKMDTLPHVDAAPDHQPPPASTLLEAAELIERASSSTPTAGLFNDSNVLATGAKAASATTDDFDAESEEENTIVHNEPDELDDSPSSVIRAVADCETVSQTSDDNETNSVGSTPNDQPRELSDSPIIITTEHDDTPPEPPKTPRSRRTSISSISSTSYDSSPLSAVEESPTARHVSSRNITMQRPELNAAMSKRRSAKSTAGAGATGAPWPPTQFSHKTPTGADDLERKISDILTTIPAHIRLTSSSGPDAVEVKPRNIAPKSSRGYLRATRSSSVLNAPEMTLSPVKNDHESDASSGRRFGAASKVDNDIKLYHLTQTGKDKPIKLYIRRVGENGERVMVRVGGGWADLGEYLRQYAEHHGRRAASEGKFEVMGMEVKTTETSPGRSETAMSKRRVSSGRQTPATTPKKSSGTPKKSPGRGIPEDELPPPMPSFITTAAESDDALAPWYGAEVGLAGPKAKKTDLSDEKLEWISDMMKQARSVSGSNMAKASSNSLKDEARLGESRSETRAESRAGSRAGTRKPQDFGDLGKVGGTKRIFMRGSSAQYLPPGDH